MNTNANVTPPQRRLLIVDDDRGIRDLLTRYLGEQGFYVKTAENATAMDRALLRDAFDLLILDLMLPGEDGLSICRRLRETHPELGILMLTARGDDVDRIIGLEMGADDYLPKPFNPRELVARIQAVMRRRTILPPGAPVLSLETLQIGALTLDLSARTLQKGEEVTRLTTGEFAVLKAFLDHPQQPLSRERLTQLARGREHGPFDRAIDVQISRLRKLIEPDPQNPRYLQTVWGFGYVYVPDGESAAK